MGNASGHGVGSAVTSHPPSTRSRPSQTIAAHIGSRCIRETEHSLALIIPEDDGGIGEVMTTPTKKPSTGKNLGGRPRVEIDLELVEKLASIYCTDAEIAAIVGVSQETFTRRKRDENFAELLDKARAKGKASLRRLQWRLAEQGNAAVVIFLGKNLLGQRDKFDEQPLDLGPLPWTD
jgi:hypothetical protein